MSPPAINPPAGWPRIPDEGLTTNKDRISCVARHLNNYQPSRRLNMEYRRLGASGFRVPVLSFGTGTFGGTTAFFRGWGSTDVAEATRMVDICLEQV